VCYLSNNCADLAYNCAVLGDIRVELKIKRKSELFFKPFLVQPFLSLHCQW